MRFADARLRLERLPSPLPRGRAELTPTVILHGLPPEAVRADRGGPVRDAAALVLLYPDVDGEARLVLTVRPDGDHVHAGQVALPGGKREPGEDFPAGTALREAMEEVGLDADAAGVSVVGRLDEVDVRVSGFLMVPVLAVAERAPRLVPQDDEVAAILHVAVGQLPALGPHRGRRGGAGWDAPALRRLPGRGPPGLGRHRAWCWPSSERCWAKAEGPRQHEAEPGRPHGSRVTRLRYQGSPSVGSWSSGRPGWSARRPWAAVSAGTGPAVRCGGAGRPR